MVELSGVWLMSDRELILRNHIGLQRGTTSFVRSTALELMKLGSKLVVGTQVILENTDDILNNTNDLPIITDEIANSSKFGGQPATANEGFFVVKKLLIVRIRNGL